MRRLTQREQSIFVVCVLTISVYLIYNGIVKPFQAKIERVEQDIQLGQQQLSQKLKTIQRGKAVSGQYNAYHEAYRQSKSNEEVMSSILAEIEGVARELQLGIFDLKPKRVQRTDFYNQFSVSLTINSEFVDIIQFLHILQSSPHLFEIEQVDFDKGSNRNTTSIKTQLVLSKILVPQQ